MRVADWAWVRIHKNTQAGGRIRLSLPAARARIRWRAKRRAAFVDSAFREYEGRAKTATGRL